LRPIAVGDRVIGPRGVLGPLNRALTYLNLKPEWPMRVDSTRGAIITAGQVAIRSSSKGESAMTTPKYIPLD
jgi:hypothetical protein